MKLMLLLVLILNPVCAESKSVVDIAVSQMDKMDSQCALPGCYHGSGRDWCSEFVSWVYHDAGKPFSGGKHVDWILNDADKIQTWFEKNGTYVNRQSPAWETFKPSPGDYVLIGRVDGKNILTKRKHSGIVEFVDEDATLHTIEGNNHGRPVARYEYPTYLKNTTDNGPSNGIVLGFGHAVK